MYKIDQLPNGLRIITHPIKDRNSISIGIWVGTGGRYETDKLKGAAHFLEHVVFKGSKHYTCDEIKSSTEGVGGMVNAFTSEEQTCFYAKIPSEHWQKTFDVLSDMVFYPKLNPKDVNKEKTVIIEEIKMYRDLPQYHVLDILDGLVWPKHPLGKSLAGTPESVAGMTHKDLKVFHHTHYAPGNIVVSVCGDINHQRIVDVVKKKLGLIKAGTSAGYEKVRDGQTSARVEFKKKDIEQMHVALGVPGYHENHPDRYALSLMSIILGGNMSSRLFVEVREKRGLAYSISSSNKMMHDTGMFLIRAGVDNSKIVDALKLIMKELDKIKTTTVGENEFKRAKDYLLGQLVLSLEDTMEHMLWIGEALIAKNSSRTLDQVIREFKRIRPADVKRVARAVLEHGKYNLAIVGPVTDNQQRELEECLNVGKTG